MQAFDLNQAYKPDSHRPETNLGAHLNVWAAPFESLCANDPGYQGNSVMLSCSSVSGITDQHIFWLEVTSVLRRLRRGKSADLDLISGELYKLVKMEPEPVSELAKSIVSVTNETVFGNGVFLGMAGLSDSLDL